MPLQWPSQKKKTLSTIVLKTLVRLTIFRAGSRKWLFYILYIYLHYAYIRGPGSQHYSTLFGNGIWDEDCSQDITSEGNSATCTSDHLNKHLDYLSEYSDKDPNDPIQEFVLPELTHPSVKKILKIIVQLLSADESGSEIHYWAKKKNERATCLCITRKETLSVKDCIHAAMSWKQDSIC